MHALQRFLADYDLAMLRAVAGSRGVTLTTNRQADAADQLASALLDPLSVQVAVAHLSAAARQALDALLRAGGRLRAPQFYREFGALRPIGPGRLERDAPWQDPASASEELLYAGLIYRAFHTEQGRPGEFVFVPEDLYPLLPQPPGGTTGFADRLVLAAAAGGGPPDAVEENGRAFVEDLFRYLVYVQTHDVRPYADGRLAQRDLAAVRRRLVDGDERRFALLRHLAGQLGFVVRSEEALRLEAGPVRRWLSTSAAEQLATLQEAWRADAGWYDLCHVPALACDRETGWLGRVDPVAARQAILTQLARCPAGAWWTASSFVAAVKAEHPDFQRPDGDYASWYIRDVATGTYLSGFDAWDAVEGRLLLDLLASPLRWLGVVASAEGQAGPLCRLTGAGARWFGLASGEADAGTPPPARLAVQPDFHVVVPSPGNLYTRFQLERFAERAAGDPLAFRLTAGSLSRALGRGLEVDQILAFLHQASEHPLPVNVVGQLRLWAGRFGQVSLEEMALLTARHERVLKELSVLPETRGFIDRILTPTTALVHRRHLPRLRKELRALGYFAPEPADGEGGPDRGEAVELG